MKEFEKVFRNVKLCEAKIKKKICVSDNIHEQKKTRVNM
jgi:hypothetical protein